MSERENLNDLTSIPLADDDPQVIIDDGVDADENSEYGGMGLSLSLSHGQSMDSIRSTSTTADNQHGSQHNQHLNQHHDSDIDGNSPDEQEEKARLISQVLELQNTLDDLSQRVDSVKEENLKLRSETQVLGQYIENLMSASSVFSSTSPKGRKN